MYEGRDSIIMAWLLAGALIVGAGVIGTLTDGDRFLPRGADVTVRSAPVYLPEIGLGVAERDVPLGEGAGREATVLPGELVAPLLAPEHGESPESRICVAQAGENLACNTPSSDVAS